jgi:superfamily II DNA/RNA helicase
VIIVSPTVILANQTYNFAKKLVSKLEGNLNVKLLTSTSNKTDDLVINDNEVASQIVIGTPGRLKDILIKNKVDMQDLQALVLDKADMLLDPVYEEDVNALYRDDRLLDSDIVMAIEVIEHIDKDKLDVFLDNVFKYIRPKFFIMTTPNKDYNKFYNLEPGKLRHKDHRFEFTEKEFAEFVRNIPVKYPEYTYETTLGMDAIWRGIGEFNDDICPTFGTLLIRRDMLDA